MHSNRFVFARNANRIQNSLEVKSLIVDYFFNPSETYFIRYQVDLKNLLFLQNKTVASFEIQMTENEKVDGVLNELRIEKKTIDFDYPPSEKTPNILFQKMKKNKDCLLRIVNASNANQFLVIGIDQIRYDANPVLARGSYEEALYDAEMTGEIIQAIPIPDANYRFDSTIVSATFDTPEWPVGFISEDGIFDVGKKQWLMKYALYDFPRAIPKEKAWTMRFQIAPLSMPENMDAWLFRIIGYEFGTIDVFRNRMEFVSIREDAEAVSHFFASPLIIMDLYFSGMTNKAMFEVKYLNGMLNITYNEQTFLVPFAFESADLPVQRLRFYGADAIPKLYFDNLKIVYHV